MTSQHFVPLSPSFGTLGLTSHPTSGRQDEHNDSITISRRPSLATPPPEPQEVSHDHGAANIAGRVQENVDAKEQGLLLSSRGISNGAVALLYAMKTKCPWADHFYYPGQMRWSMP